jgi:acyl-CoA reductase-like NAD-dependent aldehyde dehydrogenase
MAVAELRLEDVQGALELGGKAPMVVFDDADLDAVTAAARLGGYLNSGQDCTAASRILAGPRVHDALLQKLVPAVESLAVGVPDPERELDMGPVISPEQRARVLGFLKRAVDGGAQVLTGGEAGNGPGAFVHAVQEYTEIKHVMVNLR